MPFISKIQRQSDYGRFSTMAVPIFALGNTPKLNPNRSSPSTAVSSRHSSPIQKKTDQSPSSSAGSTPSPASNPPLACPPSITPIRHTLPPSTNRSPILAPPPYSSQTRHLRAGPSWRQRAFFHCSLQAPEILGPALPPPIRNRTAHYVSCSDFHQTRSVAAGHTPRLPESDARFDPPNRYKLDPPQPATSPSPTHETQE
ncbi:hypothetical protein OROMI_023398 [Orobanche minor]